MQIHKAKVEKLLITQPFGKEPISAEKIELLLEGVKYDRHFGKTRNADIRTVNLLSKGIEVANLRMVTIVSQEELDEVSKQIGTKVLPEDVEANITISGFKDFTKIAPGTFISFPRNAILYVTHENLPCIIPSQNMIKRGAPKKEAIMFARSAMGNRGVTALVYAAGAIKKGDEIEIIPLQSLEK